MRLENASAEMQVAADLDDPFGQFSARTGPVGVATSIALAFRTARHGMQRLAHW